MPPKFANKPKKMAHNKISTHKNRLPDQSNAFGKSENYGLDTLQKQALVIREPDEHFDPTIEPQNGEEFLMQMLYERKRCPSVMMKRPKSMHVEACGGMEAIPWDESNESELSCHLPRGRRVTPEWKAMQIADFIAARDKISRLSILLGINHHSLECLLIMINDWLLEAVNSEKMDENEEQHKLPESAPMCSTSKNGTNSPFDLSSTHKWLGVWLYAVFACLMPPLEPDVHSTMRNVARTLLRLRSRLMEHEDRKAVPYNLLVYIIAKVFDQLDFAEFV